MFCKLLTFFQQFTRKKSNFQSRRILSKKASNSPSNYKLIAQLPSVLFTKRTNQGNCKLFDHYLKMSPMSLGSLFEVDSNFNKIVPKESSNLDVAWRWNNDKFLVKKVFDIKQFQRGAERKNRSNVFAGDPGVNHDF